MGRKRRVLAVVALAALAALLLAARVAELATESINWDEFAMLDRASRTLASGELKGGGRPGLATLALLPIVDGCEAAIATARAARWLWLVPTVGFLAGLFVLIGQALRRREGGWRWADAALGVGALAMVPVFHRWSIQVRTDQVALAFAVWGAVALLASARRLGWAALAGAAFGLGMLATPKAAYVVALGGLLAVGDRLLDPGWRWAAWRGRGGAWRRDVARGALVAIGLAAAIAAFAVVVRIFFAPPTVVAVGAQLDTFAWYREIVGFAVYEAMAPTLWPQIAVGVALLAVSARLARRRARAGDGDRDAASDGRDAASDGREVALAWAVVLLGVLVGGFHAAAFTYFWMTLGIFPAVAIAIGMGPIRRALPTARAGVMLTALAWLALFAAWLPAARDTLRDRQWTQRESLGFVERALPATARGYQLDGALYCRADPDPLPVVLREQVVRDYGGAAAEAGVASLIREFRARPIAFVVGSHRLGQFPRALQDFWAAHYVPYRGTVMLAGARLRGAGGATVRFDLIAPGRYRWLRLDRGEGPARIAVGGVSLTPGAVVDLAAGPHAAELVDPIADGALVLAVDEPPAPLPARAFHSGVQLAEITGRRP